MSAKFGYNIRTLANNNFLNMFKPDEFKLWEADTPCTIGNKTYHGINRYIAVSNGTSGETAPVHTVGIESDDQVNWLFYESVNNDEIFNNNLYAFIGKKTDWITEEDIPNPDTTDGNTLQIITDILSLRKISNVDMRFAIKNNKWESGTYYDQYDPNKDPYSNDTNINYDNPFYCVNSDNKIYKCLNNNNAGPSLVMPTGISTDVLITSDNYSWKYMGELDINNTEFNTISYMPVNYLTSYDSNTENQWNVQEAATKNGVSTFKILKTSGVLSTTPSENKFTMYSDHIGQTVETPTANTVTASIKINNSNVLSNVIATSPGTNYTKGQIAIISRVGATGSGAYSNDSDYVGAGKVTLNINGGIDSITMAAVGQDYISARVVIVGEFDESAVSPTEATASAIISNGAISGVTIDSAGSGYKYARAFFIPRLSADVLSGGGIAEIVMAPPQGHGYNIAKELCANSLIVNFKTVDVSDYFLTGADNAFRQLGLIIDTKDLSGNICKENYYIGPSHEEYTNELSVLNKISDESGEILYLSNFGSIEREVGHVENIKIIIVF